MIRTLIVLGCVVFFLICVGGMRWGWKNRGRRQGDLAVLPAIPTELGPALLPEMTALYVGTTTAENWQDRVVARGLGLRAAATATLTEAGLYIDRQGAEPVFVPADSILGVGLGAGLAGKVMGAGGLLVVRWRLGVGPDAVELDTGLRADDRTVYPDWVHAIEAMETAA
jgi:hypothetical protein